MLAGVSYLNIVSQTYPGSTAPGRPGPAHPAITLAIKTSEPFPFNR